MDLSYNKALKIAKEIQGFAKGLIITGSIKRKHPIIHDIDFLTLRDLDDVENDLKKIASINTTSKGDMIMRMNIGNVYNIDIWHVPNRKLLPYYQLEYDSMDNIQYKKMAKQLGMKLSVKGLYKGRQLLNYDFKTKNQIKKYIENSYKNFYNI